MDSSQNIDGSLEQTLEYDVHDRVEDPSLPAVIDTVSESTNEIDEQEKPSPRSWTHDHDEALSFEKNELSEASGLNRIKSWDASEQVSLQQKKADLGVRGLSDLSMRAVAHPVTERGSVGVDHMKGVLTDQERRFLMKPPLSKSEFIASLEDNLTVSTATFASRSTIESLNYSLSPNRNSSQSFPSHSPDNRFSVSSGSEVHFSGPELEFASQVLEPISSSLESIIEDSMSEEDFAEDADATPHVYPRPGPGLDPVSSADADPESVPAETHSPPSPEQSPPHRVTRSRRQRPTSSSADTKELTVLFSNKSDIDIHRYANFVTQMGGTVVEQWEHCTHCVTTEIKRTRKLMCALASGKYIVSIDWLDESRRMGRLVDIQPYILCTPSTGEHSFRHRDVYIARSAGIAKKDASELVKAAGGRILRYTPDQYQEDTIVVADVENDDAETTTLLGLGYTPLSKEAFLDAYLP